MSKTPRTDEHLRMKEENGHVVIVSRDFARQLETELADKNKQLAEARDKIGRLQLLGKAMDKELSRKDKLIEQMRSLIEREICKPCTSMRCYRCNFKAALSAAERG